MRRLLPLVLAMCASGCGGCVGDSSDPAPGAAQSPAPAGSASPVGRGMRPHRFGLLRPGEDAATPAPAPAPQGDAP